MTRLKLPRQIYGVSIVNAHTLFIFFKVTWDSCVKEFSDGLKIFLMNLLY